MAGLKLRRREAEFLAVIKSSPGGKHATVTLPLLHDIGADYLLMLDFLEEIVRDEPADTCVAEKAADILGLEREDELSRADQDYRDDQPGMKEHDARRASEGAEGES